MELSFSELRAKEVVNTQDGRKLGKVCDIILCYPENKWIGIVVPNGRGFGKKGEVYIELRNIVKIGEDVILVNVAGIGRQNCGKRSCGKNTDSPLRGNMYETERSNPYPSGRNYEEFE